MEMENPKYEMLSETKTIEMNGSMVILHRIRALRDLVIEYETNEGKKYLPVVKKGDLGGWIEKPSNLSQEGNGWVGDEAKCFGDAKVRDNGLAMFY